MGKRTNKDPVKPKVRQLTVAHNRWDTRIWLKQVKTLHREGLLSAYEVADGLGDAVVDGITIHDLGGLKGRGFLARVKLIINAVRKSDLQKEEILHFHDPMFLPTALWLKLKGYRVVYDVHEDYPRQVFSWQLPFYIRYGASIGYSMLEWLAGKVLNGIVTVTPTIAERFPERKTVLVHNYPILNEMWQDHTKVDYANKENIITYVGRISAVRGIYEIVKALAVVPDSMQVSLLLGGEFSPLELENELKKEHGWRKARFLGWLDKKQYAAVLASAKIGLVLIHPHPRYLVSLPTKMFEYMAAGLPVIASNFPYWDEIISSCKCGLSVNPLDPEAVADAIKYLLNHPEEAQLMGERGRQAVQNNYSWSEEAKRLIAFYKRLE